METEKELTKEIVQEMNDFFQDGPSDKIRTITEAFSAFMAHEGLAQSYADPHYIPNHIHHTMTIINFFASMSEKWDRFRNTNAKMGVQ